MARGVNFFLTFGFKIRKDKKSSRMANRTAPHTGAVFTGDMQTLRQFNRVFTNCILVNCKHLKYARTKTIIFTSKNSNNAFYTGGPEKKIPKSRKWRSVGPGRKTRNGGFFSGVDRTLGLSGNSARPGKKTPIWVGNYFECTQKYSTLTTFSQMPSKWVFFPGQTQMGDFFRDSRVQSRLQLFWDGGNGFGGEREAPDESFVETGNLGRS